MPDGAPRRSRGGLPLARPTARGWAVLIVGLLLLIASAQPGLSSLAWPACLALAAPAVAALATLLRTRASVLARSITPDVAMVGEPVVVEVRVGAAAGAARWSDARSADLVGAADGILRRDADGVPTAVASVTATRRGRHETGPLSIEVADAFGLVRARRMLSGTAGFVALPAIASLSAPPTAADGGVAATSDARRGVARGFEDQIPREWRSGDGIRRVHWRATAHRGALMVRQEEPHEDVGVAIVLDAAAPGYLDADELDRAVDLVAAIAAASVEVDARTAVTVLGDDTGVDHGGADEATMLVGGAGATSTLEDVLVRLALLHPGPIPDGRPAVPAAPVVVAVLGRIDESRAAVLASVRRSGSRGIAIVQGRPGAAVLGVLEHAGWSVTAWDAAQSPVSVWALATAGAP